MEIDLFLFGVLMMAFAMVLSKRIPALIRGFGIQSFLLFLLTLFLAHRAGSGELYVVAGLLLLIKVMLIPYVLRRVIRRINVDDHLGLFVNPTVSMAIAIFLTYLAYLFTGRILFVHGEVENNAFFVSLSVTLIGLFLMVFRMKALAQVIGLLVMENGLFLAAASVSAGMPFFVEIAIFFDVFLCVLILGIFVYKINRLFTHIDVDKLTELKG
jgi:hydrogenase-4 component E